VLRRPWVLSLVFGLLLAGFAAAGEPALPPGLEGEESGKKKPEAGAPALPAGLGGEEEAEGEGAEGEDGEKTPELPAGLGEPSGEEQPSGKKPAFKLPFDLSGFVGRSLGLRTQKDDQKDATLGDMRLQLELEKQWERASARLTVDFLYDPVFDDHDVELEEGTGAIDLREAFLSATPVDFADLKVGRQILTWGTGDLVFINDLFPKDWRSFFIGRDNEYLKAPSDALKVSLFNKAANLDVVYTPRFDADRFIDGKRISYWNPVEGKRVGRDVPVQYRRPDDWFEDDELALRLYRNVGGYELAAYYYRGFWKSPSGMHPLTGKALFQDLDVYGASVRGKLGKGIANFEFGYYRSDEDLDGDDEFVKNGQLRFLLGYAQELARDFSVGAQWYVEHMLDHSPYAAETPPGAPEDDQSRHVLTLRLTRLLLKQNLRLSLFTYWSPTDRDAYLRPKAHYKINDSWSAELGGNIFLGEEEYTFFGQFEKNNNIYASLRFSF
jgi:Protein of unknown function (DUF1302)